MTDVLKSKLIRIAFTAALTALSLALGLSLIDAQPAYADDPPPIAIGTLPSGKVVTITFRVAITDPLQPAGTTTITNQATISAIS